MQAKAKAGKRKQAKQAPLQRSKRSRASESCNPGMHQGLLRDTTGGVVLRCTEDYSKAHSDQRAQRTHTCTYCERKGARRTSAIIIRYVGQNRVFRAVLNHTPRRGNIAP